MTISKKFRRPIALFFLAVFCNYLYSCAVQRVEYQLVTDKEDAIGSIDELKLPTRSYYYILHQSEDSYELSYLVYSNSRLEAQVKRKLSGELLYTYNRMLERGDTGYVSGGNLNFANQIHLYVGDDVAVGPNESTLTMYFNQINLVQIYQTKQQPSDSKKHETDRTVARVALVSLLVVAAVIGGIVGLFLLACGCPHVYLHNGNQYTLSNTLFTGAVAPQLERNDYKIIPDNNNSPGELDFIVKNEDLEKHHINQLEIWTVQHSPKYTVFPDQSGGIHALSQMIEPISAINDIEDNVKEVVSKEDDLAYSFSSLGKDNLSSLYVRFDKPEKIKTANLVLRLKNTAWSKFVYHEFTKLFGERYTDWKEKNKSQDRDEREKEMKKQGMTLNVSIKQNNKWIDIEDVDLVGSVSYNQLVVPIPPSLLTDEIVEVKLSSGFMFWELDFLAIDFSEEGEYSLERHKPAIIDGNDKHTFIAQLEYDDEEYVDILNKGDSIHIQFDNLDHSLELDRTLILHSKGYYTSEYEFEGKMNKSELARIKLKLGLSGYSKELFDRYYSTLTKTQE